MQGSPGVDPEEVERFDRLARSWWDPNGPMAPLHQLNPVRLAYIRERVGHHFGRDERTLRPLDGFVVLDVGCGAGLVSEPLARMGGRVTAIDPAGEGLQVARQRARAMELAIDYQSVTIDALLDAGARFDLVVALEVVEHVVEPEKFLEGCVGLLRPGGALVLSTLNRTARSFAFGIVAAEYLLNWVPRGTHQWRRFLKPSEVARPLRRAGAKVLDVTGVVYDPLRDGFKCSDDLSVNYLLFACVTGGEKDQAASDTDE